MSEAPPSPPQAPDEAPLVARERDPNGFEQLIAAQAPQLQRMLRRVLGSPSDAEEVLQETFLKAWRAIERFRGEARFSTWLYRIALNEAHPRPTDRRRHARAAGPFGRAGAAR
jgi:RNA polymerase sigma-70 factor (ECF subfamily)